MSATATPPSDQPPAQPGTDEPSPAVQALTQVKGLYGGKFPESLRTGPRGETVINPVQIALDNEVNDARIAALADCLVAAGLIDQDTFATQYRLHLEQKLDQIGRIQVARMLRGKINGHGG